MIRSARKWNKMTKQEKKQLLIDNAEYYKNNPDAYVHYDGGDINPNKAMSQRPFCQNRDCSNSVGLRRDRYCSEECHSESILTKWTEGYWAYYIGRKVINQ